MNIDIKVRNKIASSGCKCQKIVCDNTDYVIVFDFDEEWNDHPTKTARFVFNGQYYDVIFNGTECPAPPIHDAYLVSIGVYAGDLRTTTPAFVDAVPSVLRGDPIHVDPPEDVYDQIMALMEHKIDDAPIDGKQYARINGTWETVGDAGKPFISLERMGAYLYEVTFDNVPELTESDEVIGGACTSFVRGGKLYRNLDWTYAETAEFFVRCKGFSGMAFLSDVTDGNLKLKTERIGQLPYHINDGVNDSGIMVSSHVLYNDWEYDGSGDKSVPLYTIPYLILTQLHDISDISTVLSDALSNIKVPSALGDDLMQFLVTDGTTTYVISPSDSGYEIVDATENPKLTNFKWVSDTEVDRVDLQLHPVGVERWNAIESSTLEGLRYTKAYESPIWLSEFIGLRGTDKYSTDEELTEIYTDAHAQYLERTRDGALWQTMHSVIYGANGIESLCVQENWAVNYIAKGGGGGGTSNFNDLSNRPKYNGSAMTGSTNIPQVKTAEWDAKGSYSKPSGGIPKTDLASGVQSSLEKADSALQEHQSLAGYATETYVNNHHDSTKQDTISDLDTIRSGAALGATALQEHQSLAAYRTASAQDAIDRGKADVGDSYTKAESDAKYLTEHQSLANYYTKSQTDSAISGHHDSSKQDAISDLSTIRSGAALGATAVQPEAGKGLFSGAYDDLTGKPTIPTNLSQLTADNTHRTVTDTEKSTWNGKSVVSVSSTGTSDTEVKYITIDGVERKLPTSGQGGVSDFDELNNRPKYNGTAMTSATDIPQVKTSEWDAKGTYSKPSTGIPKTDLASAVQTSLGLADSALQEHQSLAAYRTASAQDAIDAGKADIGDSYTKDESDAKYLTEHQSLANYYTKTQTDSAISSHHDNTKQDTISDLATIRSGAALGTTALQEHQSLVAYRTASAQDVIDNGKQPTISDLATIRSGAALGATAVQPETGKGLFSGNYNDLSNKPTIPTVPTNVSAFTNDAGYLTEHQSLSNYYTKTETDSAISGHHDSTKINATDISHETWTFTLDDDSTVTKEVVTWTGQA